MICRKSHRLALSFIAFILFGAFSSYSFADEIVDDITVHKEANGDVVAVVKFAFPIQYLRHFPQGKSPYTSIFFNILGTVPVDVWQDYESHRTPPSDLIKDITVSTMDRGTGPKVQVKFYRPAEFSVTMGSNNQVLLIRIKPVTPQQKNEDKPAPAPSLSAPAALPIAVLPTIIKTPSAPSPTVAVATAPATTAPATAPVATMPVAPAPTAAVAPSGDVTAPKVVLAPSLLKPVHIPLGGKDGLPPFPDIDQVVQPANTKSTEKPSLADQITKANNQAAPLMEKAGNALLAGQSIPAIEAFDEVLKLPPNKYSPDAQLWIGIAREKSGQLSRAILEFKTYLKLYPEGKSAKWVNDRLAILKKSAPAVFADLEKPISAPVAASVVSAPPKVQNTEIQYSEFGSLSMYYYTGANQTTTTAAAGSVQTPTSFSVTDQKSLVTNVNMTARGFNNEYDNRVVFQDFYAANFLPGQQNTNRLGAAYYELKDRIVNYSVKIGRQSGFGGGVMGRFDGVSAGYGFTPDMRANVVTGQLSDFTIDTKPHFNGVSLDFGVKSPLGGSVYFINQTVSGITDRRAAGGNMRYFDQRFTLMSMLDYDIQFKALNMITVQGTLNGGGSGNDYNFLLDRRRNPILDIRNAVNGTSTSLATLMQNGWTTSDLILLANQRTTVSDMAQIGMTNHLNEKWNIGTDFFIAKTEGLAASGGIVDPIVGCVATEGCVPATPSTGNTWTISERMTGMGVIKPRDVTNFSLSYTKGQLTKTEAFQFSNHADLIEKWTLDSTFRLSFQSDSFGGKSNDISPTARVSYQVRNNLAADAQLGLDWTKSSSSALQSSSTSFREFMSIGFRLNF